MTGNASRAYDASAGGAFLALLSATTVGYLAGASLRAGAGALATATLRTGGAGGAIIGVLACLTSTSDHFTPAAPVIYSGQVHVTIAGAGAELILYGN